MTEIQSTISMPGVDRLCQLIGKQAANLLMPGPLTKPRSQFTKEANAGWRGSKTILSPRSTKMKKKNKTKKGKKQIANFYNPPKSE